MHSETGPVRKGVTCRLTTPICRTTACRNVPPLRNRGPRGRKSCWRLRSSVAVRLLTKTLPTLCKEASPTIQWPAGTEDAEDALQDCFLRAFVHIKDFDGRSKFSTWLTRIAINCALMILRRRRNSFRLVTKRLRVLGVSDRQILKCAACNMSREKVLRRAVGRLRPGFQRVISTRTDSKNDL